MEDEVQRISRAIGALMRVASSERVHAMRQEAVGVALTHTEMRFLSIVHERGPLPVTELGAALHLSQPTASRTLSRLEDDGYVRRGVDVSDGRVARYEITPAGRRLWKKFEKVMARQLATTMEGIAPARRRQLADLLEELATATHKGQPATVTRSPNRRPKPAGSNGRDK